MTIYYRMPVAQLPCLVGLDQKDGSRSSQGTEGFLSYGPHLKLSAGTYFGGFYVRSLAPSVQPTALTIDIACDAGLTIIANRGIPGGDILPDIAGLIGITFELEQPDDNIEVRLFVFDGILVNVREIVLFQTRIMLDRPAPSSG